MNESPLAVIALLVPTPRPMTPASGPPAITAECLAAAISAVLLLGAGVVNALLQLEALESGSWFSLAPPK